GRLQLRRCVARVTAYSLQRGVCARRATPVRNRRWWKPLRLPIRCIGCTGGAPRPVLPPPCAGFGLPAGASRPEAQTMTRVSLAPAPDGGADPTAGAGECKRDSPRRKASRARLRPGSRFDTRSPRANLQVALDLLAAR